MSPSPIPDNEQDDPDKNQDSNRDIGSVDAPQFNIAAGSSSDSDFDGDDDPSNHGYQLLPQGQDAEGGVPCAMDDEETGGSVIPDSTTGRIAEQVVAGSMEVECAGHMSGFQVPPLPHTEATERRELWCQSRPVSDKKAPMDPEQADKIKAMMAGFTLPSCQQPSWARFVPEDQWKSQLLGKLETEKDNKSGDSHSQPKRNADPASSSKAKAKAEKTDGGGSQAKS